MRKYALFQEMMLDNNVKSEGYSVIFSHGQCAGQLDTGHDLARH